MEYENRIKILSKSKRDQLGDHQQVIDSVLKNLNDLESEPVDGSVFTDTIFFEEASRQIVFRGKGGPATRVARFISRILPGRKVRIFWVSENWDSGHLLFRDDSKISS